MKTILHKYRIQLILLVVLLGFVSYVSLVKRDYTLIAPGFNNEVGEFMTVPSEYSQEGTFRTTSVIVEHEMTILQYFASKYISNIDVSENPDSYQNIDIDDLGAMSIVQKDDSLANSLVVGYENANAWIAYESYLTVYLTYNYLDENTLELGDKIVEVNGETTDLLSALQSVECEATVSITVLRDDKRLTYEVSKQERDNVVCSIGLYAKQYTEILHTDIEYELHDNNTGGSSGGLMQSLYVFNQLTPNDITGGKDIAGTGTIDVFGNVGSIGGIEQKIVTSVMNGIDIFFVPHLSDEDYDNYIKAQAVLETLEDDMILVPVSSFDEAVTYLEGRYGGAFDE